MRKILSFAIMTLLLASCKPSKDVKTEAFILPAVDDIAMYQVNPRVFAPEKSLNAVAARIDSIRALGVNMMWVGRQLLPYIKTQGVALGYVLVGLSGRHNDYKLKISVMQISILTHPLQYYRE